MAPVEAATDKIVVTLPDGTPLELAAGATGADAAAAIGAGLAKAALAIKVDGVLKDL
ncbi:MAG TPA: TGS domain-containing protein, partial [Solirubrobacterales bacterium]|nr:TGS domain-containing protein [Solirubrobacterales bacterium]